jgi:DNA-binding response OmpR family regulator
MSCRRGPISPQQAQRALRLLRRGEQAVLFRRAGPVLLDLALRDGWSEGRRLALHPTEFLLLWRLAEVPGQAVTRAQLFRDVWRIGFDPGTNRIEVHVSRLRRKLAAAGAGGLVETVAEGGYRVVAVLVTAAAKRGQTRQLGSGPVPRIARTGIATRGAALP